MLDGLNNRLAGQSGIREIRGKGLMIGVELDRPCQELVSMALDQRLLINVTAGNVIRLLPPLILSDDEADQIIEIVGDTVSSFLNS